MASTASVDRAAVVVSAVGAAVLPTTLTVNPFVLEKQAQAMLVATSATNTNQSPIPTNQSPIPTNQSPILNAAVVIASAPPPNVESVKFRHMVYAQRGATIKLQEALDIISQLSKLPPPYISFSGNKYIITSIQEKTYYCRNANAKIGNGLLIAKLEKVIVLATYTHLIRPVEAILHFENYVHENFV